MPPEPKPPVNVKVRGTELSEHEEVRPGARILVADDSADMREYIQRLLTAYDVAAVADGAAALRSARARRPDLVLTDVVLPGVDGLELMRAFRADPTLSDVPLILLSTGAGEESRIEGLEAGADDCLVKPFSARELLASVRAQLRLAESRRLSREALRASEERYRALVTASSDVVFRMTGDWSVMSPLDGRDMVASNSTPILGWMENNLPEFEHARVRAAIDEAIGTKQMFELEHQVIRADGTLGWTHSRAVPIFDDHGHIIEWFGTASDVTRQKQAEERVHRVTAESERMRRLYETVLSATPDFVYVFSLDHRVLYANDSLIRMWGRGRDGALGKTFLEIGYEPWHAEMHDREIDQVRATREPIRGEVPFTGTDGRRIYDYIFVPVIGADGEVEAVAGTTRDVTDRKESELALAESDRKKDEFIALLAHELRNPLAPIRNGLEVIRQAGDPAVRERAQEMMDRQLAHLVRLIDDLLDVSRISRNRLELRRARVTLTDVVESAVEAARPAIDAAGHELFVTLPAWPVHLDADLTRLAQVLSNLLANSAKYTARGGTIWLSAERSDGVVEVMVRDTGIGIPRDSLPRIFDMFSQVDRSIERAAGGLGIGLALVKGLTEMHGGTVVARSDGEGRGSTFVVTLPTLPDGALGSDDAAPRALPARPARRVLVVDDSRDGAESLAMMLELAGHEVALAFDGLEAIERAAQFRPEVILMDVGMPRLNGLDATRRIRQEPWGRAATIIALTGWGQEVDREQSRDAGCNGHLVKPVAPDELQRVLGEHR
jgi:PAS domain S-box-containing protein